ncbi:hypothetical protein [Streptomyces sp. TLI_146]|uniref:LexA family protein n=1 Tax=Streptomyces sp. TLI_146 TaxID=1938858 RepID=UPI000C7140A4|nr:hypothetical protein [Streptomyces sp. TLI_146]PKV84211.1 LexA DNA binding domain-containing protein [Streptomyces sp. TLI_146]
MLTEQKARITRSAGEWVAASGEAPMVRELAAVVGVSSSSSIAYHLRRMREQGVEVETRGRRSGRCPYCGH